MAKSKYEKIENPEGLLCDYGCKLKAEYKLKSGKLCCSDHWSRCPEMRKNNTETQKGKEYVKPIKIENKEGLLCDYGCRNKAEYKLKSGKLCCSEYWQSCPESIKKARLYQIPEKIENNDHKLCDFCNEGEAKYKFKNGKLCCEEMLINCPSSRRNINQKPKKIENKEGILCDYGCGLKAQYKYDIGKYCCSESFNSCPEMRKHEPIYSIEDWQEKYPTFAKVEEMRYNPDKSGEIQVHCKNHNCPNSKEQGGWFTPTTQQISDRVTAIEKPYGFGECNFYCSDECKQQCPLFRLRKDPNDIPKDWPYTSEEYETWRQEVLKRDNHICQFCKEKEATIVHHIIPKKLEPFHSLDPDYGLSVCIDCHHFIHRSEDKGGECSTGRLAHTVCSPKAWGK